MRSRFFSLFAIVALVLGACSAAATPAPTAAPSAAPTAASTAAATGAGSANLTVYGAASLSAVLAQLKTAYESANPGVILTVSTDASSALETKIEQGAPVDIFLSADTTNPQKVVDKGLAEGTVTKFAGNLLTVIVPIANPAKIQTPADLANPGVKIVAAGAAVPITKYATMLVANLARQPGYPADFVAKYNANVVSKEDNVSAVVTKVGLGEGDAGICYVTDAKTSKSVTTIPVPDEANVPATYGGVVIKASPNVTASQAFMTWLVGPDAQAIFATFGFLPPS